MNHQPSNQRMSNQQDLDWSVVLVGQEHLHSRLLSGRVHHKPEQSFQYRPYCS
jgi:hypothetical protein